MTFDDAVKIVSLRDYIGDLAGALHLVGFELAPAATPPVTESPEDDVRDMITRIRERKSLAAAAARSSRHSHGTHDSQHGDLLNWDWSSRSGRSHERQEALDQDRQVVPSVLPVQVVPASVSVERPVVLVERESPTAGDAVPTTHSVVPADGSGWGTVAQTLLVRTERGTQLDVPRVVEDIARWRPIVEPLPVAPRRRLARTVQLVFDIELRVGPFCADLDALLALLTATSIDSTASVIAFRNSLAGGCGSGPVWTWSSYVLPRSPAAIVFVTGSHMEDDGRRRAEIEAVTVTARRRGHLASGVWFGRLPGGGAANNVWLEVNL